MARRAFEIGDTVKVVRGSNAPVRYQGRKAEVTNRVKSNRGSVYVLNFYPRKATPLTVKASDIQLIAPIA